MQLRETEQQLRTGSSGIAGCTAFAGRLQPLVQPPVQPLVQPPELWPPERFQQYLRDPKWSSQTRTKYANKRLVTQRHGPIACNETVDDPAVTADTFRCSENHPRAADECNFKCMPQSCVTQQLLLRQFGRFYSG